MELQHDSSSFSSFLILAMLQLGYSTPKPHKLQMVELLWTLSIISYSIVPPPSFHNNINIPQPCKKAALQELKQQVSSNTEVILLVLLWFRAFHYFIFAFTV